MPIYHDDENVRVYENEICFIDSLRKDDVAILVCHGNDRIAPWGELLSTRAKYLGAACCLTDGCVRDSRMIRGMRFPVYAAGTNPVDTKYRGKMFVSQRVRLGGVGGTLKARRYLEGRERRWGQMPRNSTASGH